MDGSHGDEALRADRRCLCSCGRGRGRTCPRPRPIGPDDGLKSTHVTGGGGNGAQTRDVPGRHGAVAGVSPVVVHRDDRTSLVACLMNRHTSTLADAVVGVGLTRRPEREVQFAPLQAHGPCTKQVRGFWKQMLAGGGPRALLGRHHRAPRWDHRDRPVHEAETE